MNLYVYAYECECRHIYMFDGRMCIYNACTLHICMHIYLCIYVCIYVHRQTYMGICVYACV